MDYAWAFDPVPEKESTVADVFLQTLEQANKLVLRQYPTAQFYEASRQVELRGSPWRFVFNDPSTTPNSTVIIKRLERGFGEPEHINEPWLGDIVIDLPISLGLDEAYALCNAKDCGGDAGWVTLRFILYPGVTEPKYIITMTAERRRCFVGVRTRTVECQPMGADET
jgi:hypothetical protein